MGKGCGTYREIREVHLRQGLENVKKRPLGRARLTWEDNTKMDQEVRWERKNMDWINVAQDRDRWWAPVIVIMNL
jgi:hypothetical protein